MTYVLMIIQLRPRSEKQHFALTFLMMLLTKAVNKNYARSFSRFCFTYFRSHSISGRFTFPKIFPACWYLQVASCFDISRRVMVSVQPAVAYLHLTSSPECKCFKSICINVPQIREVLKGVLTEWTAWCKHHPGIQAQCTKKMIAGSSAQI